MPCFKESSEKTQKETETTVADTGEIMKIVFLCARKLILNGEPRGEKPAKTGGANHDTFQRASHFAQIRSKLSQV